VIDVSNASPTIKGSVDTPGNALESPWQAPCYVADGSSGLQVIDVSDPASPAINGTVATPGDASGVVAAGSYAYVVVRPLSLPGDRSSGLGISHDQGERQNTGLRQWLAVAGSRVYLGRLFRLGRVVGSVR